MEPPDDLDLTEPERRLWDAVTAGQPCNFGDGDPRTLRSPDDWGRARTIRGHVLAKLLVHAGAIGQPTIRQVQIQGARVTGEIDLTYAKVAVAARFERCFVEGALKLSFARTRNFEFGGCVLASVEATGASIEGLLAIAQSYVLVTIRLAGAGVSHAVVLSGSTIAGGDGRALSADSLEVGGSLFLGDGFHAAGEARLLGARIGGRLVCSGGRFDNPGGIALVADGADIASNAQLDADFHATGEVRLLGARIGREMDCSGGRFENPGGFALIADGAEIGDGVLLNKLHDGAAGFHATGEVRLVNARIGRELNCVGGRFENPGSHALSADGAEIGGTVLLGKPNGAAGFYATGEVRLPGAQITGLLNCAGGRFENPEGTALAADSAEIGGTVLLGKPNGAAGFYATGEVRLVNARISDQLDCAGGRFENPGKIALSADRVDIRGGARLAAGFRATGEIRMPGAQISGQLSCDGGRFENREGKVLNLEAARVDALLLGDIEIGTAGQINLHGTKVSLLADDPVALASQGITLHLDGFVYERIAPNSPQDVSTRLQWLERQRPGYHPQPFDQLAAVFQRSGRDHEATRVLIEKRRKRRETLQGWWRKFGDALLDLSVLYGWQAWRPLAAGFAIFLLVFGLVLAAQAVGLIVSLSDVASPYNPFIHALDVFLPIVDLGVESRWTIDTANGGAFAWLVMAFLWTLKLVGWGTVTLALAALTGIVKRD